MGRTCARIRRSPSCPPLGRHDTDNRCLKIWLGSNRSGKKYRGYVDSGQKESPHELPRDESSSTGLANLCLSKTEYSHPVAARQLISHCIHNHKGGTHSRALSDLAQIWEWCLTRRITIHAEHIPGVYNTVADAKSRWSFEPSDWKLHKGVFDQLQKV